MGFSTEYHIQMTISGTRCSLGDSKSDFTKIQVDAVETALATGFCDVDNFPAGTCSIKVEELSCEVIHRALKHHLHLRKLADDTNQNDLILQFTVAVSGHCANYDCSDGNESMKAGKA